MSASRREDCSTTSRATAAAARRRLRPSDVFTASFSAMLATAAVYDTRRKDERLLQWDQAIEEVRSGKDLASISTPGRVSIGKAADEESNIMGNEVEEYTPDANICRKLEEGATTVRKLMSFVPMPILEAPQSTPRRRESMTPVWDELEGQSAGGFYEGEIPGCGRERSQATGRERIRCFDNVALGASATTSARSTGAQRQRLVLELRRATSMGQKGTARRGVGTDAGMDAEVEARSEIRRLTELMMPMLDGTTAAPDYPRVGTVGSNSDSQSLNATLDSITKTLGFKERNYDLMIAKICYNLLTSTSVPNVATYELLIRAFTKLRQPELAEVVVHQFKNNGLRPDEGILSAILMHYGMSRDPEKFYTTVRQMAGLEDGLGFERHHIFDLTKPTVQKWALDTDVIHRDGYLQEKAHRNSDIFESLIRGCMTFHNLDGALRYLKTAIKEGCYVRTQVFADIVYYSLTCPERTSALLRIVTALSWQFGKKEKPGGGLDYNSDVRGKIHDVLEACGLGSALSGAADAAEVIQDVQHPLARYIYPEPFAPRIRHFHAEEAKDMASYRARRVPLPFRERIRGEGEVRRMRVEEIPREFGGMLMADLPSFVKISKLVEEEGGGADGGVFVAPPSLVEVVEEARSNFRPMAATSYCVGGLGEEEYAEEGPLAGCF
ncbi:hypothetical protein VE04_05885 [Pseudogymnoascus sp. 24MN13]|nr:hypothetical protein VE04_05885 [Pseudogymnoascus sp. 24MN13]